MIKVSALYPNSEGVEFDYDYYVDKHLPLVRELLGDAVLDISADKGIGGENDTYVAMGHMIFESMESFQQAFAQAAEKVRADIPEFTNAAAVTQISEPSK